MIRWNAKALEGLAVKNEIYSGKARVTGAYGGIAPNTWP